MLRKLFLIDGLAGFSKNDLVNFLRSKHAYDSLVISKYTTRHERHHEEAKITDLISNILMMKFRDNNHEFYEFICDEVERNGYRLVRDDQTQWRLTGNIYNPIAVLYCCKYGIALFDEPEPPNDHNPNVAYGLGIMHSHNKNCLVLMHEKLESIPFDFEKEPCNFYSREIQCRRILKKWINGINAEAKG